MRLIILALSLKIAHSIISLILWRSRVNFGKLSYNKISFIYHVDIVKHIGCFLLLIYKIIIINYYY